MSAEDKLTQAISDWQRKHHIADNDPMMATLELVRIYLRQARDTESDSAPPSFDDFRGTIELLDRRSKAFVQEATDLITDLRRFSLNLQRLNRARLLTQLVLVLLSLVIGALLGRGL